MADEDTKPANYIFCKTIPHIAGQKIPVCYPSIIARGPSEESWQDSETESETQGQIDLELFFT